MGEQRKELVVFLAGPYRTTVYGDMFSNLQVASKYLLALWKAGFVTICPHRNTFMFDGLIEDDVFLDGYREILRRCDVMVLLPNWRTSSGTLGEVRVANQEGLPMLDLEVLGLEGVLEKLADLQGGEDIETFAVAVDEIEAFLAQDNAEKMKAAQARFDASLADLMLMAQRKKP